MSVASHQIELLKIQKQGCVRRFSVQMVRLGLKLLVGCFMSARMIPNALEYILKAAELDRQSELDLPARTYFTELRSMVKAVNRKLIEEFVKSSKDFVLV